MNDEALQATRDAMAEKPEKGGLDFDFNSGSTIDASTCCTGVIAADVLVLLASSQDPSTD